MRDLIYVVGFVIGMVIAMLLVRWIVNSDLPLWLKIFLLK